ncbi:hypothetical protein Y696_00140 [Mesotoga sp. H07pep.5.4]|uniref:hypothetical protein n=1 Tax=Mesotoga sp. H07pep.5.4 TaxID=1463664 RepID=UPI000FF13181|nr:hypothetical protein [Mesotoga sp. H07pep.5.4]MDI9366932.1 hypothetical protein [Thermotogota bacterium]RLL82548.1 hypothetical protein Y696_00140 [Mesotoga sp. H07pep.5.4]
MILGIFLKDREISLEDCCFDVKIDGIEAVYAVMVLGTGLPESVLRTILPVRLYFLRGMRKT